MTHEQKEQIREALMRYTTKFPTQNAAAGSLQGVTPSLLSLIKNNRWERINDAHWQNVARQVGFYCGHEWQQADTGAYLLLRILFGDAQRYAMAYGVAIATGLGKTFTAKHYTQENEYAYYIACNEHMNRKDFLAHLGQQLGSESSGSNTEQMLQHIVTELEAKEEPLLIIDDAQKLKDRVLHFIVSLYKRLINHCGVIILGNDELRSRIVEGVRMQKQLYDEVYNTIGRRFATLGQAGPRDVELVCRANGLTNDVTITEIKDTCKGNMHHATELIHQAMIQVQKAGINETNY